MKKKITALVLSVFMVCGALPVSAFTAFAADEASTETVIPTEITATYDWYSADADTYTIDTVADLAGFAKLTQNAVEDITDAAITFEGKTILLANDLTFGENEYWFYAEKDADGNLVTPSISYRIKDFAGTFDGQGHTISGLNMALIHAVETTDSDASMVLFRSLYGTLKNLTVADVTITSVKGYDYLYPLVYRVMADATVENCHSKNVNIYATGAARASGLIGSNYATVKDCSATNVTIYAAGGSKNTSIGGLFRGLYAGSTTTGCTATNISITVDNNATYIGGFSPVTNKNMTVTDCAVNGVKLYMGNAATSTLGCIGGFVGNVQNSTSTITYYTNCTVTGLEMVVTGTHEGKTDIGVGGFIGSVANATDFTGCSAAGTIDASAADTSVDVGGFVGNYGWNYDYAITMDDCVADTDIVANGAAGGFVGHSAGCRTTNAVLTARRQAYCTYTNCVAAGNVTSLSAAAGGFVGDGDRGTFDNCRATGDVVGVTAGGFWGEITPNASKAVDKTLEISDCSASGAVLGTDAVSGFVGTIVTTEGATVAETTDMSAESIVVITGSMASPVVAGATSTTTVSAFAQDITSDEFESEYTATDVTESVETITVVSENTTLTLENGKIVVPAEATVKVNEDEVVYTDGGTVNVSNRDFILVADKNDVAVGEIVTVTVTLSGRALVGAKWTLVYDNTQFELIEGNIQGEKIAGTGITFAASEVLATYTFKAIVQEPNGVAATFTVENCDAWNIEESNSSDAIAPCTVKEASVTVVAPEYEVYVAADSDYVAGKKLVLVYTNSADVSFSYAGETMYDTSAKYTREGYMYSYAIVVDAIEGDYAENVAVVYSEVASEYIIDYNAKYLNYDLNASGEFNLRDVTSAFGVYNGDESTFERYMSIVLNADINADGVVNGVDVEAFVRFVRAYNSAN